MFVLYEIFNRMIKYLGSSLLTSKAILFLFLLVSFLGNAQTMQVKIKGGAVVVQGTTITLTAGNRIKFEITNTETNNCKAVNVQSIELSNTLDFSISPSDRSENIKPEDCHGEEELEFDVTAQSAVCGTTTTRVTITGNNFANFWFDITVIKAPIISVLGGSPLADIVDGSTATTATNGTYFGVVEQGLTKTRGYVIVNTGSCPLTISSITSSLGDFAYIGYILILPTFTPAGLPYNIPPGGSIYVQIVFTAPIITPPDVSPGTYISTISVVSNDATATPYTFNVSAELLDFDIPGPGGVTADFRLWLKSTRGVTSVASKVSLWKDLGSNGKSATQTDTNLQPTFLDNITSNINFNPVVKFENNGISLNQYLENADNGFYSQDIFIVMEPDVDVSISSKMTIFSGTVSTFTNINGTFAGKSMYDNDGDEIMNDVDVSDSEFSNDLTAVGLGNLHSTERLWYNQGSSTTNPYYNLTASSSRSYSKAGIINAHNYSGTPSDGMSILFNSINDANTATKVPISLVFDNVGYIESATPDNIVWGTPYKIGKNAHDTYGNLNGRVAEIMTFAQRVPDIDRPKIETYLAIKYGITLGETQAEKNYVNSTGNAIWDITANAGFNYNIAGIGRADNSDLNQKQSKSINETNEVTIGLGLIADTNSANVNEFKKDGDFLVWGCDGGAFTGAGTNIITIATGVTTSLTRIDRKWKIVESKVDVVDGDVENVFVGIPSTAFSENGFTKTADEEYVLIVSDDASFNDVNIIDVIPLKSDGGLNLQTWYDFDGVKFFTFGKAPKLTGKRSVNIGLTDYLVGEYALNLNINEFTVSSWIRSEPTGNIRTIAAKGTKLQMNINAANKLDVVMEGNVILTSNMAINNDKWHHASFVYNRGTVFIYIDGILDKSVQNVAPPTPNFNRFSIGAVYVSKNDIRTPFLGEIDELYILDVALTQDQVRYLMNQEMEKVTGNLVNGKTIPKAITKNEVATMPWSALKAYYDFNSFYGTTVEGLTNERNFLRIRYLDKTKTITGIQTAPLPYVSAADGVWDDDVVTWTNSSVQMLPNSVGLDGTRVDWNIVETNHDISSGNRDIIVLGLKNNSGKIIVDGTLDMATGTGSGHGLRVTHYLKLDGVIDLVGESQLMQDEGSILDEKSGGYLDKDQQGTASSYNYNYWSSSVGPITTFGAATGVASPNLSFSVKGNMLDGNAGSITFQPAYYAADLAVNTPPNLIISSYWLYKFYGADDDYNAWFHLPNENSPLEPGEGYTMKGTSKIAAITANQNYKFRGKPYNGDITLALDNSAGDVDRLIGNPYPSAIDANEFILDNIKETIVLDGEVGRNTKNVFNGALYFWHHFSGATHYLAEYVGGYATYTLMGGVDAVDNDVRIKATGTKGGKFPERYIPANQGFFVLTALPLLTSGIDGSIIAPQKVEGGNIVFKNSQRVFLPEGFTGTNDGSLFFKGSKKTSENEAKKPGDQRTKIRLLFDSPTGYHRQLLAGVDENTTNHFDLGYDAPIADINKEDMFWTFDNAKFVIQGVNNFDSDQELPLGIKISKAGLATIKIDGLENMDEDISLHIKDKLTGENFNKRLCN
jgi:hypothetical protein